MYYFISEIALSKNLPVANVLMFLNVCNKGARQWFWWAETCSTFLYGIKVLCLMVCRVYISLIVNTTGWIRIKKHHQAPTVRGCIVWDSDSIVK